MALLAIAICLGPGVARAGLEPPTDGYDWVDLVSGERLKGELVTLYDDELMFDSEVLDQLLLDWEDVGSFRGHGKFSIGVSSGETVTGALRIDEQHVTVEEGQIIHQFSRADLVSITRSAYRELDNWSAEALLGLNVRSGNTESTEYNLLANLERRTPGSRISFDYLGNFNEAEGIETANNHRLNGSWDRFSGSDWFWRPLFGQYYRDAFQNIRHQLTLETGLGYELIDNSRTEWSISGGLGVNTLEYRSVQAGQDARVRSPALTVGTDFETELTRWLDYMLSAHITYLDEDSGRYQHHLLTGFSTDLPGMLDFSISFVWDRIARPQVREDGTVPEKDDFRFMVGVGFEY